ncbi:MAG: zf-HC2 domain-containing protein [Polyangiaceae bacterium]
MLSCKQMSELGTEFLDRRLSFGMKLQFRMHLTMCRHCRTYLRQLALTAQALSRLEVANTSSELADELITALSRERLGDHGS